MDKLKHYSTGIKITLFLLTLTAYFLLGYHLPRASFYPFIISYSFLFASYFYWIYATPKQEVEAHWKYYLAAAIAFRFVFLVAFPNLSDDYWRYLWDGRLLAYGINPYQLIPSELVGQTIFEQAHLQQLYQHLNSPDFYTVYPPVQQLIFGLSSFFFSDNVLASIVFLRLMTIALEVGTILVLIRLFRLFGKPIYSVFFYAFNPLVIIELTGNLHTEITMIFFLALAFYKLCQQKLNWSAIFFAMAVGAKLLPLLFLPLFLRGLWFQKGVRYCFLVGLTSTILFVPFFSLEIVQKMQASMGLYFAYFEFNASIYYILRYGLINEYWHLWAYHEHFMHVVWVEELLRKDWYVILRQILPIIDVLLILALSFRKSVSTSPNNFFKALLFIYTLHFLMATTIHPWYLSTLVFLAILTPFRFPMWWSYAIGWSYISYQTNVFAENSWLIGVEYALVFGVLIMELSFIQQKNIAPKI